MKITILQNPHFQFFWIGWVWVTRGRIWERSGKGFGDVWEFSPTSMSSKMDQKQLQAFATVKRTEKHLMFAKAKARKKENKNEIQQSECMHEKGKHKRNRMK